MTLPRTASRTLGRRLVTAAALAALAVPAPALAGTYAPATDMGSMFNTTLMTGAQAYWQAGYTGRGVDVAVIDTGVVPVDGLTSSGKVVNGPDLSFESQTDDRLYLDTYGHGTHIAGIIAGRDDEAGPPSTYAGDQAHFLGMAPDARIVSLKVGDAHGAVDVTQVIAAIDWVAQHAHDDGLNIRVLNLSYGTDSTQPSDIDPLAQAVENAWRKGIVVVAAAGNGGFAVRPRSSGLTDPGRDPFVIAVGASDPHGTATYRDDTVASFSSTGCPTCTRWPDLVAPGTSVVSLRDPGSLIDQEYGGTATVGDRFFRGSGTSQATAVVSGAAALIIQQRPSITPDGVKRLLASSATPLPGTSALAQGSGELNLRSAYRAPTPSVPQRGRWSTGAGSVDASRGTIRLVMDGVQLKGEIDIFGNPVDTAALAVARAAGTAWVGGSWNGHPWSGPAWTGTSWSGVSWLRSGWSNDAFTKSSWSGRAWSDVAWDAASWQGSGWAKSGWSSNDWRDGSWAASDWQATAWR